ncbi:hypothetical protein M2165_003081 [Variovorax sp. TBS-050B]|uniref:hypothetical protein n=1 Tax=Variovorax sp. TBS-050B TaxID=2940551 RepID=UPI0024767DCB|nr:hypothetical protein [Variovorax sp. TBS-050B]MDH6593192.1 hypothetical protein [Variovorax sp. TBS-050B]
MTPVAWEDDCALEEASGVVYIDTRQCAQMRAWARQLRKLHASDETYKTEKGLSPLSAAPLREASLRALGTSRDLYSEGGQEVRSGRLAVRGYITTDLLAVVTDRVNGDAVGSYPSRWGGSSMPRRAADTDARLLADRAQRTEEQRRSAAIAQEATDAQTRIASLEDDLRQRCWRC